MEIDTSRQKGVIVIDVLFLVFALTVIALRFISKRVTVTKIGIDDWLMLVAVILVCVHVVVEVYTALCGLGLHVKDVNPEHIPVIIKILLLDQMLYYLTSYFAKISILIFYLRLFGPSSHKHMRTVVLAVIGFLSIYTVIGIVVVTIQCIPLRKVWDPLAPGSCINYEAFVYFGAAVNIVTDLLIFVLPLPALIALTCTTKADKYMLICLFSLSFVGCIMGALRIPAIHSFFLTEDFMWNMFPLHIWSQIELATGIVCGSAPAIKPLICGTHRSSTSSKRKSVFSDTKFKLVKECEEPDLNFHI